MMDEELEEASLIGDIIINLFPKELDGKKCILWMKSINSSHWKKMEWLGHYFEELGKKLLKEKLGGKKGPKIGNTEFDYMKKFVWDLKFHVKKEKSQDWIVLNDCEAIEFILKKFDFFGIIIGIGEAEFDLDGSFYKWHENLKGGPSKYTKDRIKRLAPSRQRKKSAIFEELKILSLTSNLLNRGLNEGWIKKFQEGFRNADGSLRKSKYQINLDKIPKIIILQELEIK